jgi:hypothetical protein
VTIAGGHDLFGTTVPVFAGRDGGCGTLSDRLLESTPPGAEARTSFGPGCKTPCSVNAPLPDGNFAVTYTLEGFLPVTVPVAVTGSPAGFMTPGTSRIEPNPVVATLQPIEPPKPVKPQRAKRPNNTAAGAAPPPSTTSAR